MTPRRPRTRRPWQAPVVEELRHPHAAFKDPEHIDTTRVLIILGCRVGAKRVMRMAAEREPFDRLVADDLRHFALGLLTPDLRRRADGQAVAA